MLIHVICFWNKTDAPWFTTLSNKSAHLGLNDYFLGNVDLLWVNDSFFGLR